MSEIIIEKSHIDRLGYHCWSSHYYPFVGFNHFTLSPTVPDIIGTSAVVKALTMMYIYNMRRDQIILDIINSSYEYFERNLSETENLTYFLYTPNDKNSIVPNASAVALDALSQALKIAYNPTMHDSLNRVLKSLLALQNNDGYWAYKIYNNGKVYLQHDFHQGYMIDGLISYLNHAPENYRESIIKAISRATLFYKKMFTPEGRSFYRFPRKYPTDIHNQSQGIITFSKLFNLFKDSSYISKAVTVAKWTIENMQDDTGFFYCWKGKFLTNKIPYMRWGQAWMLLALTTLLHTLRRGNVV